MAKVEIDTDALTKDSIKALADALEDSEYHLLSDKAFKRVRMEGSAAAKAEAKAELQALQEQHDELEAQHKEAADRLKELEREKMSEAEKAAADAAEHEEALAQARADAAEAASARDQAIADMRARTLDAELPRLLKNVRPELAEAATLLAKSKLAGLSANEAGELIVHGDDGVELVGDAAAERVSSWFSEQTHFHTPQQPGPGTIGGPAPAPTNSRYQVIPPHQGSVQSRYAAAQAADRAAANKK
jgi:hypothetical protein